MDDNKLLESFASTGSEEAFRALVQRHLGMVLGIALRRTGSHSLAEDIGQAVFTILARKARRLKERSGLAGWLHRTTLIECAEAHRRNHAHARKMNAFSKHLLTDGDGHSVWQEALPLLDEAIATLPAADRDLILLRFFERKGFREIAGSTGKTEGAAQKQCERALEKISGLLRRKGVVITSAVLASGLAAQVAQAASPALVQCVSQGALAGAAQLSAKTLILQAIEAMSNTKLKTAVVVALLAAVPLVFEWFANRDLRRELAQLRQQVAAEANARPVAAPRSPLTALRSKRFTNPSPVLSSKAAAAITAEDWEKALFEPDPVRRAQRIAELLAGLTTELAPDVAEVFSKAQKAGMGFGEERRLFFRAWGKLDGAAAVDHALKQTKNTSSSPELLAALAGWASARPQLARAWVDSIPEGSVKEDIVYGLLDGWSMVSFNDAAAFAESRPRSQARDRFITLLLSRAMASGGFQAAQSWFLGIDNDEHNSVYKQRAFDQVTQAMLYQDPSAAAQWIAQFGGQSFLTSELVAKAAAKLAQESPTQAIQWLNSLAGFSSEQVAGGLTKTIETWAKSDPYAAGNWLLQNQNQPGYDNLLATYALGISSSDPRTAFAWAQSVANETERNQLLLSIASDRVRRQDNAAAQQLVNYGYPQEIIDQAITSLQASQAQSLAIQSYSASYTLAAEAALDGRVTFYGDALSEPVKLWDQTGTQTWKNLKNPHGNEYQGVSCSSCHTEGNGQRREALARWISLDALDVPVAEVREAFPGENDGAH